MIWKLGSTAGKNTFLAVQKPILAIDYSYPSFAERPNGHFQSLTLSSPQEFRHVRAPQKDNCYLKFWPQGALRSPVLKLLMSFESFWPEIFDKMWVFNQTTDYYSWQFQVLHIYIYLKRRTMDNHVYNICLCKID